MKNAKHIFIIVGIIIISFLFDGCSAYQKANTEFDKGDYEAALNNYLKDLKKNPDREQSKEKIKIIAEKLIPEKLEQGDGYLASDNYHSAWDFIKSACYIIAQVQSAGISFQSEQQYLEKCQQAKEGIAQGIYINGTRLMAIQDYRTAYDEFQIIKDIFPAGYKDTDQLIDECLRKGQVRIVIVIRPYYNKSIENRIYTEIKEKIINNGSPFLAVIEPYMTDWEIIIQNRSFSTNLLERKLDGMVILSIAEYKIIPQRDKKEIMLCYLTKHQRSPLYSSYYYTGIPIKAYQYTNEKTLRLAVSYEFVNAEFGKITSMKTARWSDTDKVTFTEFANSNDSLKDKNSFAFNCPEEGKEFTPQWYPSENFEEKSLKSDEEMLLNVLPIVSNIVKEAVLKVFNNKK